MDDLILSMIVSYNEYGDVLGFNKTDIDNFINKYDYLKNLYCNERGYIVLWKNKYISDTVFSSKMDIEIENDKLYLVCDNFYDILNSDYEFEIDVLSGEMDWTPGEIYDNDVSSFWSDYNKDTFKSIYDFCIKHNFEIEDEVMTTENLIFDDNDVYFNGKSLSTLIDEYDLEELKSELNIAIVEAQESADQDEIYEKVKSALLKVVNGYEWRDKKLYIEIPKSDIDEAEEHLKNSYGDFDFETEDFGSLRYILKDMEKFIFTTPNYDYIYGSIDNDLLNEFTQNRLEWY